MRLWILAIGLFVACNLTDPRAQEDAVRISVDRESYASGDSIVVTIHNGLESPITAYDHHSYCGIAQLERSVEEDWEETGECFSMAPAQQHTLAPVESWILRIPVLTGTDAYPAVVRAGTYRWRLVYSVGETFSFAHAERVTSHDFEVR